MQIFTDTRIKPFYVFFVKDETRNEARFMRYSFIY